jgi:HEAT repeat protein
MTPVRSYSSVLAFGTALLCAAAGRVPFARAAEGAPGAERIVPRAGGIQRFQTSDQAELLLSLDELAPEDPDAHQEARAVSELLAAGQVDVVTDHALESLGRLGVREGRDALLTFTHHRRVEARRRAYIALARLKDQSLVATLSEGLRDSAPEVRASAAQALADLRASSATPLLLRALARGVTDAAPALGKVGDEASVEQYNAFLGRQPLHVMLAGYANYLQRDDLPESVKLRIVAVLEDVSGAAVKSFLAEQLSKPKTSRSPQLQRAMSAVLNRVQIAPPAGDAPKPEAAAQRRRPTNIGTDTPDAGAVPAGPKPSAAIPPAPGVPQAAPKPAASTSSAGAPQ